MLIKIITLSFDSAYGGFNDLTLRDFMKDVEIISIRDHFFIRNEVAYLAFPRSRKSNIAPGETRGKDYPPFSKRRRCG